MVVLGLDVSTNTIGYAFIEDKKILDMGFIDISKEKTIKDKAYRVLEVLDENLHIDETKKIIVEDSLSGFASGFTRMQTIIKLAKINSVICFLMEWKYEIEVELVNPNSARKRVFGKARVKGIKAKDYVKEQVEKRFDTEEWCTITARGNWSKQNLDMYDALVCALSSVKI